MVRGSVAWRWKYLHSYIIFQARRVSSADNSLHEVRGSRQRWSFARPLNSEIQILQGPFRVTRSCISPTLVNPSMPDLNKRPWNPTANSTPRPHAARALRIAIYRTGVLNPKALSPWTPQEVPFGRSTLYDSSQGQTITPAPESWEPVHPYNIGALIITYTMLGVP